MFKGKSGKFLFVALTALVCMASASSASAVTVIERSLGMLYIADYDSEENALDVTYDSSSETITVTDSSPISLDGGMIIVECHRLLALRGRYGISCSGVTSLSISAEGGNDTVDVDVDGGVHASVLGGNGSDALTVSNAGNTRAELSGDDGDDTLTVTGGRGGSAALWGGDGADTLTGSVGDDTIFTSDADTIDDGDADTVTCGMGSDTVYGNAGDTIPTSSRLTFGCETISLS